jgi:hypothetical protein
MRRSTLLTLSAPLALVLLVGTAVACPFCPPTSPTLSEQLAQSDAVALAQWVAGTPAAADDGTAVGRTTFLPVQVLKTPGEALAKGERLTIPTYRAGKPGDLFLLSGKLEGTAAEGLTWDAPREVSETAFQYIAQAPAPETPTAKRLRYFVRFLEYPDPLIGDDAYAEFAQASYDEVAAVRESLSREKLRQWLSDPDTLASRRGLYGLMLGLCGTEEDADLLKALIEDPRDTIRLGIDGVIGGYILLTKGDGLADIEKTKLANPQAPIADVHSAMTALRFLWEYAEGVVPKDRIKQALHPVLDRPEAADLAITDLARWKDWTVQDRLMDLFKRGNPENPLGEIAVRRAIIRYMLASTQDAATEQDPPPHVLKGRQYLDELRELDPRGVAAAERLFRPRRRP